MEEFKIGDYVWADYSADKYYYPAKILRIEPGDQFGPLYWVEFIMAHHIVRPRQLIHITQIRPLLGIFNNLDRNMNMEVTNENEYIPCAIRRDILGRYETVERGKNTMIQGTFPFSDKEPEKFAPYRYEYVNRSTFSQGELVLADKTGDRFYYFGEVTSILDKGKYSITFLDGASNILLNDRIVKIESIFTFKDNHFRDRVYRVLYKEGRGNSIEVSLCSINRIDKTCTIKKDGQEKEETVNLSSILCQIT